LASTEATLSVPLGVGFSALPTVAGKKASRAPLGSNALTVCLALSTSTRPMFSLAGASRTAATKIVSPDVSNFFPGLRPANRVSLMWNFSASASRGLV
jgi:hypothetical protein